MTPSEVARQLEGRVVGGRRGLVERDAEAAAGAEEEQDEGAHVHHTDLGRVLRTIESGISVSYFRPPYHHTEFDLVMSMGAGACWCVSNGSKVQYTNLAYPVDLSLQTFRFPQRDRPELAEAFELDLTESSFLFSPQSSHNP